MHPRSRATAAKSYCTDPARVATHSRPGPLLFWPQLFSIFPVFTALALRGRTFMTAWWSTGSPCVSLVPLRKSMRLKKRKDLVRRFIGDNSKYFVPSRSCQYPHSLYQRSLCGHRLMDQLKFRLKASVMCRLWWIRIRSQLSQLQGMQIRRVLRWESQLKALILVYSCCIMTKNSLGVIEHGPARTRTISEDIWRASCRNARSSGAWWRIYGITIPRKPSSRSSTQYE